MFDSCGCWKQLEWKRNVVTTLLVLGIVSHNIIYRIIGCSGAGNDLNPTAHQSCLRFACLFDCFRSPPLFLTNKTDLVFSFFTCRHRVGGSPERRAPMGSHEWPEGPKMASWRVTSQVARSFSLNRELLLVPLIHYVAPPTFPSHATIKTWTMMIMMMMTIIISPCFLFRFSLLFWCISRDFSDLVAFRSSAAIQCSTKKPTATAKEPIARNGTVTALLTTKPSIVSSFRPFRQNYYGTSYNLRAIHIYLWKQIRIIQYLLPKLIILSSRIRKIVRNVRQRLEIMRDFYIVIYFGD